MTVEVCKNVPLVYSYVNIRSKFRTVGCLIKHRYCFTLLKKLSHFFETILFQNPFVPFLNCLKIISLKN